MGVHISKVRSSSLDTKVWDEAMLGLFERFETANPGIVNRVWEARMDEVDGLADQKPTASSPTEAKEQFISLKYVDKAFLSSKSAGKRHDQARVSTDLWNAIERDDIVAVYEALSIADQRLASPPDAAAALAESLVGVDSVESVESGGEVPGSGGRELDTFLPTHVHLAARHGNTDVLLLLLLSGKCGFDEETDASGRSALAYALWFDQPDAAKLLLKHGYRQTPDFAGWSPLAILRGRGELSLRCASDPELLELLI